MAAMVAGARVFGGSGPLPEVIADGYRSVAPLV